MLRESGWDTADFQTSHLQDDRGARDRGDHEILQQRLWHRWSW